MKRLALGALVALIVSMAGPACAQSAGVPGRFDYYVLALSWSPSYCSEPENSARSPEQCAPKRRFAFVVHGLWPQNVRGWPERCPSEQPEQVPWPARRAMLDLMPSPALVEHEWDVHGVCTGLSQSDYFALVRRMREKIVIPPRFAAPQGPLLITKNELERAFAVANPGLTPAMIAVQCGKNRLREVRICLSREGRFRACGDDVRDRCGTSPVSMPPVR